MLVFPLPFLRLTASWDFVGCRVMFLLSYAATILALLLLWAVYPQDYNYGQAAGKGLLFYPANAVGQLPADNPIPWRNDSLLYEKAPKFGFNDLTGGWMVGGIAGAQCALSAYIFYVYGSCAASYGCLVMMARLSESRTALSQQSF